MDNRMRGPKPKLQLDNYLPYLLNRVGAELAARFTAATLAPHQLSVMMWRVLVVLSNNGGHRLIDLSQMTSVDLSTLSRMVARLARLGLVSRKRSKTSNREIEVKLTPRGRRLVMSIIPIGVQYERQIVRNISAADVAVVQRVLKQMYANLLKDR
jgi:MarR family transcriptional regulator, organic hydroperoxide resistance regulator